MKKIQNLVTFGRICTPQCFEDGSQTSTLAAQKSAENLTAFAIKIIYSNFRFRNNISSAYLSWQISFLSTFRHVTLILITSNKKQHKLLVIRKWLHWNNAVNKDDFFPLFIVCCVCTVGGVNLKVVVAVYFPSQQFENGLQCRQIICRLELRHAWSFPRPPLRPTIFLEWIC